MKKFNITNIILSFLLIFITLITFGQLVKVEYKQKCIKQDFKKYNNSTYQLQSLRDQNTRLRNLLIEKDQELKTTIQLYNKLVMQKEQQS